jgi:hypothetical protein
MPAMLQRLMRHEDIQTTMKYYVDLDADEMADTLWASYPADGNTAGIGNRSGNIGATAGRASNVHENVTRKE